MRYGGKEQESPYATLYKTFYVIQCNSVHVIASATHPITIHIIYIHQRTLDYPELHNWAVSSSADGCLTTTNRKEVPDVITQLIAGYLHSLLGTHVDLEISVPFGFSYVISCLGTLLEAQIGGAAQLPALWGGPKDG